jgi:sugar/nucleoside kinase (ribokinase family)
MYWEGREVLPHVDAAVVSGDDVAEDRLIELWAGLAPALIVTMGARGARLNFEGRWRHIAPFPTREVDPTGAGDVFAAAFLIRYAETSEPLESARFASCVASFSVEAEGVGGIPTRAQVEGRLAQATP